MNNLLTGAVSNEQQAYERAAELLRNGALQEGAHLLGQIAQQTRNDELKSQCMMGLAQVMEALGQSQQAYQIRYSLAHKPTAQRNSIDLNARMMVMRQFEKEGLKLTPPDFPPRVQLEITNRCNLRCIMCTRNQMTRPTGDMAVETVKKVADEISQEVGTILCLYFLGEPLLHKGLEEMVTFINEANSRARVPFVYGIQTNAMLLNRQRARSLLQAGLKSYAISLDGLAGDLERVRPGASYPKVERNILDLIDEAKQMGIDDLVIDITKLCDDPHAPEVKRFLEVWRPRVRQVHLIGISKVEGNAYMSADGEIKNMDNPGASVGRKYCNQGQRILVHWDGQFAFCCSDVNGGIKLGSIEERSIRDVWNSPEIQTVRHKIMHEEYRGLGPCATCSHSHKYSPRNA